MSLALCAAKDRADEMSNDTKDSRLLLVLDGSDASSRAVRYVAQFVGGRKEFRICLVHVLPPLPPALREHGGSYDPSVERRLDLAMRTEQDRWIEAKKKHAQKDLNRAASILMKAGTPASAMQMLFCEPGEPEETAETLLAMANECRCQTLVVGRRSVAWLHVMFSQDISEELLRRSEGFCVWAVE